MKSMKTLLLASLLSISCVAAAEPSRPPHKPAAAALFEEVQLPEGSGDVDRSTLALFADGTIERTDHHRGGADGHATGRIDATQVAQIKAALAKASWKTTTVDIHCMAKGQTFTRYLVDGKPVFDEHVCNDHVLPDASANALQLARDAIEKAVPTATPPPSPPPHPTGPAPAACTRGAALFTEESLVESKGGSWDTYAIAVFEGGAWERVDHKKDGGEGRSNGCLEATQVATIQTELAKATWKAPERGIHCMAIGVTFVRFSVRGRPVYDEHVCGNPLDDASAKALRAVRDIVDTAAAPHTPPCCKN